MFKSVCVCVCVVEKRWVLLLCVVFSLLFFFGVEREKIEGVLKILSSGQNQIRFRLKKSTKKRI